MFTKTHVPRLLKGTALVVAGLAMAGKTALAETPSLVSFKQSQGQVMLAKAGKDDAKVGKAKKESSETARKAAQGMAGDEGKGKPKPFLLTSLTRVETHSDRNAPDDFLYGAMVVGRKVQQKSVASLLYLYRYDISDSESDGHFLGLSFLNAPNKKWTLLGSLLHSELPKSAKDGRASNDNTRLTVGGVYTFHSHPRGSFTGGLYFNTDTNLDDGQTWDAELNYDFPLGQKTSGRVGYQYSYNVDLSDSFLHQFSAQASFKLTPEYTLSAEFALVDPLFDVTAGSARPDNDNVFRLTLNRKY